MMPCRVRDDTEPMLVGCGMSDSVDWRTLIVAIKGAGEMATGIAVRLKHAGFIKIFMLETSQPLAVRRTVSFCEAIHEGAAMVEGVDAVLARGVDEIHRAWHRGQVAVVIDPRWTLLPRLGPQVVIDAILAKKNLGTTMAEAPLVIGLGPGFTAGLDVHRVIETMRGHDLGQVLHRGAALANTGIPGAIGGHTIDRVLRAPVAGIFSSPHRITDSVKAGDRIGSVAGQGVVAKIDGVLRGLIREGISVHRGLKIGDIDPRGERDNCFIISDKARAIGGGVMEAILGAASLISGEPHARMVLR